VLLYREIMMPEKTAAFINEPAREVRNAFGQAIGHAVPGWTARARPTRTATSGQYCRIEPVDVARHEADLFAAYMEAPDDRDWTYLSWERPATAEAFHSYLTNIQRSEDPLHYTVIDSRSDKAVGTAALMRIEPTHGVIEVGCITFSPLLKKTRAATESMYLMMRVAFDELGYRRYEWKCDSLNAPSRVAALRYGFTFEGIFRNALVYKGRNRDTAWHSITDTEWPQVRRAFEAWLDPANFDQHGMQIRRLSELRKCKPRE
jgi:RimJ/RimL family protein N-acetyltransferase